VVFYAQRGEYYMDYSDLSNEYSSLLYEKATAQSALSVLRRGYISYKTISAKIYAYLQYRVNGKLVSEYIKNEKLHEVKEELRKRSDYILRIREIDERLARIEAAAGFLDDKLLRRLTMLRRCAVMEAIPAVEKRKSLDFSSAISALEGIPASSKTEANLLQWANGKMSFYESYIKTLQKYNLAEV